MKKVTLTFVGFNSDEVAQRFYTWVVDGGLEDGIIDTLSYEGISVEGITDFNNDSLDVAIASTENSEKENIEETPSTEECNIALNANINGKESPNKLYVHGSAMVYSSNDKIVITEAVPQGINERILILDVSIQSNPGAMKGVCKHFQFKKEVDGKAYDQVTVRMAGQDEQTIDVHYFG